MINNRLFNNKNIEDVLRRNKHFLNKTISHCIQNNVRLSNKIICEYNLDLVLSIYFQKQKFNSLSGRKRIELRDQELKFIELYYIYIELCDVIENTSLDDDEINSLLHIYNSFK